MEESLTKTHHHIQEQGANTGILSFNMPIHNRLRSMWTRAEVTFKTAEGQPVESTSNATTMRIEKPFPKQPVASDPHPLPLAGSSTFPK